MERFDVLLRDATSGAIIKREWSKAELLRSVAWVKRMNARENNIYVRPSGEHGLALLDSLKAENLASMHRKGFAPAIRIEVNRNECQAWVKLSNLALPEQVRRLAEAGLAVAFGGKDGNVARDGYGWLAGCATHETGQDGAKSGKYVLAQAGSAELSSQASVYVAHVKTALGEIAKERDSVARSPRRLDFPKVHDRER